MFSTSENSGTLLSVIGIGGTADLADVEAIQFADGTILNIVAVPEPVTSAAALAIGSLITLRRQRRGLC
jgi:hypothetical protein